MRAAAILLLLGTLLPGCGNGAPDTGPPSAGTSSRPSPSRPTVVSLVPAVTEMLFAIGAGPQVAGVSSFDAWPPEVARLPKLGALLDPDVERILRIRPGVVVLHVSQEDVRAQLERAGIRTFAYAIGGLDNVTKTMREVGAMVGRADEAEAAAAGLERQLADIARRSAGRKRPRTLLVFGREPGALRAIDASGGTGFLHDILTLAGGQNILASERREAIRVSTETILAAAPEVILDLHYGRTLDDAGVRREREVWNLLRAVPAVRDGRVHVLAGDHFVVPGPRVVQAAADMAAAIESVTFPALPSTPRTTPAGSLPAALPRSRPGRPRSRAARAPTREAP
ncbi:MAG TPA: helical backbone metal receptor [Vicinamibacterales bacterium]|nr:helical backbone metal receptor [Vicinamibacterales bacterium]